MWRRARAASLLRLVCAGAGAMLWLVRRVGRAGADNIWRQLHRLDQAAGRDER